MNFKKIVSAITAGVVAMSMCAVSAFASTVEMDSEYVGSWGAGKCIPKTELQAIGGDVKVTLDIQTRNLANTADQFLVAPMDYDNSWTRVTDKLTSDTIVAKGDGFICVRESQTEIEFVIDAATIDSLGDSGLGFQVQNVIIKSANLESGSPEAACTIIDEADVYNYCFELDGAADDDADDAEEANDAAAADETPAETEAAAPAETAAPAADTTTTATATGNVAVVSIAAVMALAGAAAVVSKRK